VLGALWFAYAAVRNFAGDTRQAALGNAARLLDVESAIGVDVERVLQSAIRWPEIFTAANTYYLLHFPLTLTVMVLAFWRRRTTVFPIVRNSLIGCTSVALLIHLLVPMAPPRMLPGFVDAGAAFGPDPYAIAGSESANQFAAMPSMHVAWAILVGYAIGHLCTNWIGRIVSILHPILTALVVIVTGHHFVSDVAIGAALALALLFLTSRISSHRRAADDAAVSTSCRSGPGRARHSAEPRTLVCRMNGRRPHFTPSSSTTTPQSESLMHSLYPQHELMVQHQRHRQLEASAATHRGFSAMPRSGRRRLRRLNADRR
jgi:hypothetical protein